MIIAISGKMNSGKDTVAKIIQYLMYSKEHGRMAYSSYEILHQPDGDWRIVRFADTVKEIACLILDCSREDLESEEFKNKELGEEWHYLQYYYNDNSKCTVDDSWHGAKFIKLTPRKLLQLIGTDCGRDIIHPNIWVNVTMDKYRAVDIISHASSDDDGMPHNVPSWDEIIYPNWIIPDLRFPNEHKAIRERDGIVIKLTRNSDSADTHESETALDNESFWNHVIDNNGSIEDLIKQVKDMMIKENLL